MQRAPLDIPAPSGECSTRCGGIPVECAPPFCCPFPLGTATAIRETIRNSFLVGIAIKVKPSVVPVWQMWFDGGTTLQNFTARFGADFATDPVTVQVSERLGRRLPSQLDGDKLQALAASATPGVAVSLLPALPPDFLRATTDKLEDKTSPLSMDFDFIGTVPGNLAGGVGKTQRSCQVGAKPSPVDDGRQLSNVMATLVREPNGSITVTPTFRFHVVDTVDLCPGNCGSKLGTINEQLATIPMSRLEASGVSGDVPFTVDFASPTQPSFTVPPPKPPVPQQVTVSASTLFAFNSDELGPGAEDAIVAQLGDRPLHADLTQPFVVEGHTDGKGSDAVNQPLSERRARRVADMLERRYPNLPGHVSSVGFGASRPVAPNTIAGKDNPSGRQLNRRVEIHFAAPPP